MDRPRRPSRLDIVLSGVLLIVAVTEVVLNPQIVPKAPAMITEVAMALALAFRRVYPLPTVVVIAAAGIAGSAAGVPLNAPIVPLAAAVIVVFTICSGENARSAIVGPAVFLVGFGLQTWFSGQGAGNWLFGALFVGAAMVAGRTIRARTNDAVRLREEALRRQARAEADARELALRERAQIARELHDVISHSVSVMVVQAGAAERVSTRAGPNAPATVRASLQTIQVVGRQALTELAGLLGVLRYGDESIGMGPQPGLADLSDLIAREMTSGLRVEADVAQLMGLDLPGGVQLAAYRIVQEALTNVRKHSCADAAAVHVHLNGDELLVSVTDGGPARADGPTAKGAGLGLTGARERAQVYGGDVSAERTATGGFRVLARIPVRQSA